MGITREEWIERTGGFRLGESNEEFVGRCRAIEALEKQLLSGLPLDEVDNVLARLRELKGLPPVEWDYDDPND
jgi:hypothetical protein